MTPEQKLQSDFTATRVSFRWWGHRRQVDKQTRGILADAITADHKTLSASTAVYSKEIPCIAFINELKSNIEQYWKEKTIPYVEDGVRLLPKSYAAEFDATMKQFDQQLLTHAQNVGNDRDLIIGEARTRRGAAFREADYPQDLAILFSLEWSFPALAPSPHIKAEHPDIYAAEIAKVKAKLKETAELAEAAFVEELQQLTAHIVDILTPKPDGEQKAFKNSNLKNVLDFFERFKTLNITNNEELAAIAAQAADICQGIDGKTIKKNDVLKESVKHEFADVANKLTAMLETLPRRKITKPKVQDEPICAA